MSPVTLGSSIVSFENDCLSHDSLPRSVIICEDSDQLINLIASQEGVDVTDETEEGTNAIDVDSLPHLPLNAPSAPARPNPNQFQQPPPQSQVSYINKMVSFCTLFTFLQFLAPTVRVWRCPAPSKVAPSASEAAAAEALRTRGSVRKLQTSILLDLATTRNMLPASRVSNN